MIMRFATTTTVAKLVSRSPLPLGHQVTLVQWGIRPGRLLSDRSNSSLKTLSTPSPTMFVAARTAFNPFRGIRFVPSANVCIREPPSSSDSTWRWTSTGWFTTILRTGGLWLSKVLMFACEHGCILQVSPKLHSTVTKHTQCRGGKRILMEIRELGSLVITPFKPPRRCDVF